MKALFVFRLAFCFLLAEILGGQAAELRGARLFKSGPIQITADGRFVWCVNPDNDSVTRLNTSTDEAAEFRIPGEGRHFPRGVSLKEDGSEIWVACHDSDQVVVFNPSGERLAAIELPWGSGPYSLAISPDQTKALVTLHRAEALAVLDLPNKRVAQLLEHVFWSPMGIAWTEGGAAAWVNHLFAPGEHPLQTRVDFSGPTPKVSAAIRITPADPRDSSRVAAPYNLAEGGYLNIRGHGAERPVVTGRRELWLPTQYHNINNSSYSPDTSMQSAIRHIDLASHRLLEDNADKVILTAVHVHLPTATGAYQGPGWDARVAGPVDLAFSRDGGITYLLHELSRDFVAMPSSTPAVKPAGAGPLPEVRVGERPIGLAVSPTEPIAYINNQLSRSISVVDLPTLRELRQIPSTPVTGETFSGPVLRGAKIFHTSDDPRISRNNKVACASCHINAEHDGRTWNFQNLPGTHGPRSTPSMLGLSRAMGPYNATLGRGQLHRSGDRDEIQDFEHTFRGIQHGGDGFIGATVNPELGAANAGRSVELDSLATYLLSLEPLKRSPHRAPGGALSEAAVRGAAFFLGNNRVGKRGDAGCAACHVPENGFADQKFYDVGQRRETNNDAELAGLNWKVNTLSLLGLWATPPYGGVANFAEGHQAGDAMLATLLDYKARANAANPHGKPDGLNNRQLRDLAEFVLSIDGNMTAEEARSARDMAPPRILSVRPTSLTRVDVLFNEAIRQSDGAAWKIIAGDGTEFAVNSAIFGPNGDSVTLQTGLRPNETYRLVRTAPLFDQADIATDGVANEMDNAANQPVFSISDRITITLGASGYENLTVAVHDCAAVAGLTTWSHDSIWLAPANASQSTPGFVRWIWRDVFRAATGVPASTNIIKASFELHPELGDSQSLEIRRCLQRWSDPPTGGDFNSNPTGAPTWNSSAHGTRAWNAAGANRLGSNGAAVPDYFGGNDLAARVDAALIMKSMTEPLVFEGPLVTDAFRFWFDNPTLDYGYAIKLTTLNTAGTKFERGESGLKDKAPVLTLTYLIPGATPALTATVAGDRIRLEWPAEPAGYELQSTADGAPEWSAVNAAPAIVGEDKRLDVVMSGGAQFFRLSHP